MHILSRVRLLRRHIGGQKKWGVDGNKILQSRYVFRVSGRPTPNCRLVGG
jgi:hypothetical protein